MTAVNDMFKKRLAKGQSVYLQGKEDAKKDLFGPKEAGIYTLQLQKITVDDVTLKSGGNVLVAKIEHCILAGPSDDTIGEVLYDSIWLESTGGDIDRTDEFIARFFAGVGFEAPEDKADLPEYFEALVEAKPVYEARVAINKSGYNTVRITKPVLDDDTATETVEAEKTEKAPALLAKAVKTVEEEGEVKPKKRGRKPKVTESEPEPEPEVKTETEIAPNKNHDKVITLSESFGLPTDGKTFDELVGHLSTFEWECNDLQKEEIELLLTIGLQEKMKNIPAPVEPVKPARTLLKKK